MSGFYKPRALPSLAPANLIASLGGVTFSLQHLTPPVTAAPKVHAQRKVAKLCSRVKPTVMLTFARTYMYCIVAKLCPSPKVLQTFGEGQLPLRAKVCTCNCLQIEDLQLQGYALLTFGVQSFASLHTKGYTFGVQWCIIAKLCPSPKVWVRWLCYQDRSLHTKGYTFGVQWCNTYSDALRKQLQNKVKQNKVKGFYYLKKSFVLHAS